MFFDNHLDVLRAAVEANRTRVAWTGYSPITPPDAAAADEAPRRRVHEGTAAGREHVHRLRQ